MPHTTFTRRGMTDFSPRPPQATKAGCLFIIGFFLVILFILIFGPYIFGKIQ